MHPHFREVRHDFGAEGGDIGFERRERGLVAFGESLDFRGDGGEGAVELAPEAGGEIGQPLVFDDEVLDAPSVSTA